MNGFEWFLLYFIESSLIKEIEMNRVWVTKKDNNFLDNLEDFLFLIDSANKKDM